MAGGSGSRQRWAFGNAQPEGAPQMPRIIIVAECEGDPSRQVVMEERVVPAHLDTEHSSGQLIQRLGWALVDAEGLEAEAKMGAATHSSAGVPLRQ
jgi:hypothetical protein